jgi:hypothetical protein
MIAMDKGCGGETPPTLSFTVTLNLNGLPTAVVGVPLMTPVAAVSVSPGGRDPLVTVQSP